MPLIVIHYSRPAKCHQSSLLMKQPSKNIIQVQGNETQPRQNNRLQDRAPDLMLFALG